MRRDQKAQSTLEYIIILAVVVSAIIGFSSTFRNAYVTGLNRITNQMGNVLNRFTYK